MRFTALDIDGFGIFHEVSITHLPPGLVLLCGSNEAGKSTLLGFIRNVLFGFPKGASREPAYPPLAGGSHGGRISLLTRDGEEYVVERRPGKGGGLVTVRGPDGRSGGATQLSQILGGVTREVFSHLYAFSLGELQSIETLQDESVKGVIYGASAGMAMLALPRALKTLDERMAGIFKPGGAKPSLNARLREAEELRAGLREAMQEVGGYDAARAELRERQERAGVLQAHADRLAGERRRLDLSARLWPSWLDLKEGERGLCDLPEQIERFPEDGLARLDRELLLIREHEEGVAGRRERLERLRTARAALVVDVALLNRAGEVELLLRDLGDGLRQGREVPLKEQEEQRLGAQIRALLDGLGREWSEERALEIDRSVFTREGVRRHQEQLRALEAARRDAETIRGEKQAQFARASGEEKQAESALEALGAPGESVDEEVVLALGHGRSEIAGLLRDLPQRAIELGHERQQLERLIREIDPAWTAADVSRFDGSVAARKRIDDHQALMREAGEGQREAALLRRARDEELRRAQEQHRTALGRLDAIPLQTGESREELQPRAAAIPAVRRELLRRAELQGEIQHQEERLRDREEEARRLQERQREPVSGWPGRSRGALVLAIAGAGAAAVLVAVGKPVAAAVVAAPLVLAALVLFMLGRGAEARTRTGRGDESDTLSRLHKDTAELEIALRAGRAELAALVESLAQRAARARIPEPITWDGLEALEATVNDGLLRLERRQRIEEDVQLLAQGVEQAARDCGEAREREECGARLLAERRQSWQQELAFNRLRGDLTPELVAVIFGKIEAALQRVENIRRSEGRIAEMEAARECYRERALRVPSLAESLRLPGADLLAECDRFFERQENARARGEERRRLGRQLQEKTDALAHCRRAVDETGQACARVEQEQAVARARWQCWLKERGLAGELSPETALEALDRVEKCSEAVLLRRGLVAGIAGLRADIDSYRSRVAGLCAAIGRPDPAPDRVPQTVETLHRELQDARKSRGDQERLAQQIAQEETELESLMRQIDRAGSAIAALFQEGSATDEEAFRRRGALFAQRARILGAIAAAEKNLRQVSGEDDPAMVREILAPLSLEGIRRQDAVLETQEREIRAELESVRQRTADLKHTAERLASADDVARLRAEEERLRAEIRRDALAWAGCALARNLITRAREAFETDQQPRVVQEAAVFFRTLSCGRYTGLFAPLGEETIEVETASRQRRRPEELSRGTAEQLYLALRFGYIRTHAERNDPLPVVMDDVLVNFDPERARAAAGAILELSRQQQVLFFTCHPGTVDLFRELDPGVRPYRLDAGQIACGLERQEP